MREFPVLTHNELVSEVEGLRRQVTELIDHRSPQAKSPVIVRLVWDGEVAIEPGHIVKLGAALFDPTTDESAPFSGLQFHCDEFAAAAALDDYAITLGPIVGGGVGYGFMPEASWAKVVISDAGHTFAKIITGGTLLESSGADGLRIVWKPGGTGEKWCVIPLAGAGTSSSDPPLRRFELVANKTLLSGTASVQWLNHSGEMNPFDDPVTIYDPEHRFSGRIADDLYEGSLGFSGYALLCADTSTEEPEEPRWEIVEMDSLYEFVKADIYKSTNYPSPGSTLHVEYVEEINQAGYDRHPPPDVLGYEADEDIFDASSITEPDNAPDAPETGHVKVLMQLVDPDASPPTYRVYEVKSGSGADRRLIRGLAYATVGSGDGTFLIDNVVALANGYDPTGGVSSVAVSIVNVYGDSYAENAIVEAAFNKSTGLWNARRKGGSGGGGGTKFIQLTGTITAVTYSGSGVFTPASQSRFELDINTTTGATSVGGPINFLWYGGTITIPSGRERVGLLMPSRANPELWVLVDPDCISFGEDE